MHRKSMIRIFLVVFVLAVALMGMATAGSLVEQRSSLSGTVAADGLVQPGSQVREGTVLVKVNTIAGSQPAARATADGVVREVLVHPGENIAVGTVVVRLETSR